MNVIEVLEVLPFLYKENPQTGIYYTIAKSFCDKKGYITVPLGTIRDHLELSLEQEKDILKFLTKQKLLQEVNGFITLPEIKAFKAKESVLHHYALNEIPKGFEILLDKQKMFECYTTLGNVLWKVLAQIANYFHLDFLTLSRLMYNRDFKKRFLMIRKEVEQAAEITGTKVTKRKKKKQSKKSIAELTQQLKDEAHIRNGAPIPRNEWKAAQLLRVFVLMYSKRYKEDYVFTSNPFCGREVVEIKKIYDAFDENSLEVIEFLKWCFSVKTYQENVKNPIVIRFCSSDNVIREFMRTPRGTKKQPHRISSFDDFVAWIKKNHPNVQEIYTFSKKEELIWLKQAYDINELPDESLRPIIEEALKRGLI